MASAGRQGDWDGFRDREPADWHWQGAAEVAATFDVDPSRGLGAGDAAVRLERYGPNTIEIRDHSPLWRIAADQFVQPTVLLLIAAAAVAGLVGEWADTIAILAIVILNAGFGAIQEYRADRALAALRRLSEPSAKVLRDGAWASLAAERVVPGDIVVLEAGGAVPADLRLLEAQGLRVDESALTGESIAIDKGVELESGPSGLTELPLSERTTMAYRGTLVTAGRGRGVAVATGMHTELGRVARLLRRGPTPRTPLARRLAGFSKRLAGYILALCAVMFALGVARGEPAMLMLLTAVSLAVAAIPEALPAVVTMALALGARRMVARHALLRRLPAAESLGAVTVICADKTGTLTENRMQVSGLFAGGEWIERLEPRHLDSPVWRRFAQALAISHDAQRDAEGELDGDPTEVALARVASEAGLERAEVERGLPRHAELPFDTRRRRMTTLHRDGDGFLAFTKGSPEEVLALCPGRPSKPGSGELDARAELETAAERARQGQRVLGFAWRSLSALPEPLEADRVERDLEFLGLVAMEDPLRPEATAAIAECRAAGIIPVMITGDHPATARAIADQLGLGEPQSAPLTGAELDSLDAPSVRERVVHSQVCARVTPEQKLRIVEALQSCGELVAMTGDGINDAPALRQSDIGVAMGRRGTEVAREAADMVLLDDNFATIVHAVREGRRIFDNIRKFIRYTLTSNSGELWTLFVAPFLGLPLPLLPVQILWINLVTDGLPGLALATEKVEPGVMERPPRGHRETILGASLVGHVVLIGMLIGALSLAAQAWSYRSGSAHWQSVVFTVLTFCQLGHSLAIRSESQSLLTLGLFSNRPLLGAIALTVALQLAVLYSPLLQPIFHTTALPARELALCFVLPLVVISAVEAEKWRLRRRSPRNG